MSNPEYKRSRFDSDCYVVDWSEAEHSEQMSELSEMSFGTDLGSETATEVGSDIESSSSSDGFLDVTSSTTTETSDEEVGAESKIPERIIWGKPMFSRRVLEVRRGAERAWRLRQAAKTVDWKKVTQGKGYQLVKAACKEVQRKMKKE